MRVCVLQPDYSTTDVDYKNYDPPRNLSSLLPDDTVDHVFLNKLTTYKQLKALSKQQYDIFVNLCEAYLEWEIPSIDVIQSLDLLNLPYTGPNAKLYDPPKDLMKYVAYCEGIRTPHYVKIVELDDLTEVMDKLKFPLFVKPAKAGDSLGIDENSKVDNFNQLEAKVRILLDEYGPLLVEEYIDGREFTVMVAANTDGKSCTSFKPVEYVFPENLAYKTYALKTSDLHPNCNVPIQDTTLERKLRVAAEKIFKAFQGVGYGRMDFRVNAKNEIYFLEVNFTCSVFYTNGYEGSADFILQYDGIGQAGFLKHIIKEGLARYKSKQNKFKVKGNAISGYGIYASQRIREGEIIFKGEEKAQRIVTRRWIEENWKEKDKVTFRRYAYPISNEVFILWDDDPIQWAPQNHSCSPNTMYDGLNVVATRNIPKNEELTLDYAAFLDENMMPFECQCGAANCRSLVQGTPGNNINIREEENLSILEIRDITRRNSKL